MAMTARAAAHEPPMWLPEYPQVVTGVPVSCFQRADEVRHFLLQGKEDEAVDLRTNFVRKRRTEKEKLAISISAHRTGERSIHAAQCPPKPKLDVLERFVRPQVNSLIEAEAHPRNADVHD